MDFFLSDKMKANAIKASSIELHLLKEQFHENARLILLKF